jgi:hypothetical protein
MEAQGEWMYSSYSFTILALDGVKGQRHAPAALYSRTKDPTCTHLTGGWVGLRAHLDTEVRGKILLPLPGSNLDHPVVQSFVLLFDSFSCRSLLEHRAPFEVITHTKTHGRTPLDE